MTTNKAKNGAIKTYKVAGASPEQLSAAAAAPTPLQSGALAEMLVLPPLEAVATPARATASNASAAESLPIAWPEEIKAAAAALNVEIPEKEPARKRGQSGQLLAVPSVKTCPWFGQLRELSSVRRRDDSTVWVLTLVSGWAGALPSMAEGQALPLASLIAAVAAAPASLRQAAAFKQLWAGSGNRTSILGVLAHQTGMVTRLDLTTFEVVLIPPSAPTAPAPAPAPTATPAAV